MTGPISIGVNNKRLSDRERAAQKGELTIEKIQAKVATTGYQNLLSYEQDFFREQIAEKKKISNLSVTEEEVFEECKEVTSSYFKTFCEEKIIEGFTSSNGHFYRTNRDDQTNMIGQKDAINDNAELLTIYWKTENAGYVAHTREEWLLVYQEAFANKQQQLFRYDTIKREVAAATSFEQLQQIVW